MVATATTVLFDEVPDMLAGWDKIREFGYSFESYWYNDVTGDIANGLFNSFKQTGTADFDSCNADQLKAALFFEQKRYRHLGIIPEGLNLEYIIQLTSAIRKQLIEAHFRFRKPAFRFSIGKVSGKSHHVLSDGVYFFIYSYSDLFPGHGDCVIVKPEKSGISKLLAFLKEKADGWEKSYENLNNEIETQWELKINVKGLYKKVTGLNEFPQEWDEFIEVLNNVVSNSYYVLR